MMRDSLSGHHVLKDTTSSKSLVTQPIHRVCAKMKMRPIKNHFLNSILLLIAAPALTRLVTIYTQGGHQPDLLHFSNVLVMILHGLIEDISIASQAMLLAAIISTLAIKRSHWFRERLLDVIALILVLLTSLPVLLDVSAQILGYPRLTFSEAKTIFTHFDHFTTSFADVLFTPKSILFTVLYLLLMVVTSKKLANEFRILDAKFSRGRSLRNMFLLGLVAASFFVFNLALGFRMLIRDNSRNGQTICHTASNTLFLVQVGALGLQTRRKVFISDVHAKQNTSFKTPSRFINGSTSLHEFLGDTEVFETTSGRDEYPFWRQTQSFIGERRFEMNVKFKKSKPNILLLNMESWAHHVVGTLIPETKNKQTLTPRFDEFAEKGILFTSHFSPVSQTSRTLVTQLFGIKDEFGSQPALSTHENRLQMTGVPQLLRSKGYRNEFMSATSLDWDGWNKFLPRMGFHKLHDRNDVANSLREMGAPTDYDTQSWGLHDEQGFQALAHEIERLEQGDQPYFMDFYSITSHSPFQLPRDSSFDNDDNISDLLEGESETSKSYRRTMRYSDHYLGVFLDTMEAKGLLSNTIVIVSGDHGRGKTSRLASRGGNPEMAIVGLLDDYQRVPFLIVPPKGSISKAEQGLRIDKVTAQYDLLATIADLLDVGPFWQHGIGQSMLRKNEHRRIALDNPVEGWNLYAVREDDVKYVFGVDGTACVYDLTRDPNEEHPHCIDPKDDQLKLDDPAVLEEPKQWIDSLNTLLEIGFDSERFMPPQKNKK